MKERPIIFSTEMVKAILEGRKTMTRRVIKPQPILKNSEWTIGKPKFGKSLYWKNEYYGGFPEIAKECPYGQPGDRLWVRETYSISGNGVFYKTDTDGSIHIAWQSALFMPRKYSRITLKIINIRVEKLCKINSEDANAEGFLPTNECLESMIFGFSQYWDFLNGKKYPWEANPWVWVISFKRVNSH